MSAGKIKIIPISSCSSVFIGAYSTILDAIRTTIANSRGTIIRDTPTDGTIDGQYRYRLKLFTLRVRWQLRALDNRQIAVQTWGYRSDAIDIGGRANQKAADQMKQLIATLVQQFDASIASVDDIDTATTDDLP